MTGKDIPLSTYGAVDWASPAPDLLPCPFCGGVDSQFAFPYGDTVIIECPDCQAQGPAVRWGFLGAYQDKDTAKAKAAEWWNRRTPAKKQAS